MAELLFYVLSAVALLCAAGVVLAKSPMISVLALLATFFALAVVYLLLGFPFLAAVQILVYAGAILVLFLFVIMLLDLGAMGRKVEFASGLFESRASKLAAASCALLGLLALVAVERGSAAAGPNGASSVPAVPEQGFDGLRDLALALFSRHSLAFEATSLLLLATMVAVMALAKRDRNAKAAPKEDLASTNASDLGTRPRPPSRSEPIPQRVGAPAPPAVHERP